MPANPDNPRREIFLEAVEIQDPRARAAYLDAACGSDGELRRRVEALLAAEAEAGPPPEVPSPAPVQGDPALGTRIDGRYKLLQQIGEGGCGVVFMAEQEEPVRRKVALKIIKLGMDTRQVVARFDAERQALALMDHPSIAQVFDAGATESGRPYFVMELVRGIRITDYCDWHQLPTPQRLDLFVQICHAVQHAHQKGIIHRDLKPSNILVTELDGGPLPKIIDFGIAKAVEGRLTDRTLFTAIEQFMGTPAYMSPEQAALTAADIDTRSDIYSLGVLLYELLTGQTPFDTQALLASGLEEMCRTIREKEPVRPSTRLRQTASAAPVAGSSPVTRHSSLATDLDWIVMKCLEKDRRRRYETANGLAMDLRRHLNNEPVLARPPSRLYLVHKAVRRNRLGFAAAGAVTAALVIGLGFATWQFVEKSRAFERATSAEQEQSRLRAEAEAQALSARQRAYASDMNVAKQALDGNNLGRARDLLDRHRPEPGQPDLRGWEWRYLWQQTRSDAIFSLCRKPNSITALAVSHDGRWLGIGVAYNTGMSVWDLQSRQELVRLSEGEEHVRAAFSPTGPLLAYTSVEVHASGERQSHLRFWNVVTRQEIAAIALDSECMGLAFSQDGQTLVTSTSSGVQGQITLWQMPEGTRLAGYPSEQFGLELNPTGFAATPDLSVAAYGLQQGRLRVVDLRDGKQLWEAVASKQLIAALAFSPDGQILASAAGFAESDIRLWEAATGKQIGQLEHHAAFVDSLVFTPDGAKLASGSGDQTIGLWDVASGTLLDVMRGHRQEVWRLGLLPDGKNLVSGAKDGEVCLWDLSAPRLLRGPVTIPEKVRDWVLGSDGRSVLTVAPEGQVAQWSGRELHQKELLLNFAPDSGRMVRDSFSRHGRHLAVCSTNGIVQIWNPSQRTLERELTHDTGRPVPALKFIEDETTLLTYSDDHQLHLWDVAAGREVRSWPAMPGLANVADASDKQLLLEFAFNGAVRMQNLTDGQTTERHLDFIQTEVATFSPDKKLFAIASHDGYARVWDTATWKETATLGGYLLGLNSVAFSPDGRRLATGGGSYVREALRLWDVASWQDVLTLECEGEHFVRAKFSPDGSAISLMDRDGTLTIWRAPTWDQIETAEKAFGSSSIPDDQP